MQDRWKKFLYSLQQKVTPEVFNTWATPMNFHSIDEKFITLIVPSRVFVEGMLKTMGEELSAALRTEFGEHIRVKWMLPPETESNANSGQASVSASYQPNDNTSTTAYSPQETKQAIPLNSNLKPDYTFENYCEGKSNLEALTIAKAIAEHPEQQTFNPFFLYGPSGVGKTHLVTAIGLELQKCKPHLRILFISAHVFKTQFTDSVAQKHINDFIHFYQSIDVLILDDFQEVKTAGTLETFFHIFNHLQANGRKILFTCDRSPSEFKELEERMLTRLKWGVVTELQRPDKHLRLSILEALQRRHGLTLTPEMVDYIAENVSDNVRGLEGTINSLLAFSISSRNGELTLDLAKTVVTRYVNQTRKELTFDDLMAAVCKHSKVKLADIVSKSRKAQHVAARHLAMFLLRKYTNMSLSQIGRELGKRDHSTVNHGCTQLELRLNTDKIFHREVETLETSLKKM